MTDRIQSIKGMHDILTDATPRWQAVEKCIINILESYDKQPPSDTLLVCDLVTDPSQSTFKFENGLKAAGIDI